MTARLARHQHALLLWTCTSVDSRHTRASPAGLRCRSTACTAFSQSYLPPLTPPCSPLLSTPPPQVFEYLLQQGADASLKSFPGPGPSLNVKRPDQVPQPPLLLSNIGPDTELGVLDVATSKGFGWEPGAVRAELARLIQKYEHVPKAPPTVYYGPHLGGYCTCLGQLWRGGIGRRRWLGGKQRAQTGRGVRSDFDASRAHALLPTPRSRPAQLPALLLVLLTLLSRTPPSHRSRPCPRAHGGLGVFCPTHLPCPPLSPALCHSAAAAPARALMAAWESLEKLYPPPNWRPPPPAGYEDAQVRPGYHFGVVCRAF